MCAVPNMAIVCSSLTSCFPGIFRTILRWLQLPGNTFVFPFQVWFISIVKYLQPIIFSASPSITFLSLKLQHYYYYYYYYYYIITIIIIVIPLQIKPSGFWNGVYNSLGGGSACLRAFTCTWLDTHRRFQTCNHAPLWIRTHGLCWSGILLLLLLLLLSSSSSSR